MRLLNKEETIKLHREIIKITGGIQGVRDNSLLESALLNPYSSFDGQDLYKSIEEKIAICTYYIIKNHPFVDREQKSRSFTPWD